jgi:hypothetical protein
MCEEHGCRNEGNCRIRRERGVDIKNLEVQGLKYSRVNYGIRLVMERSVTVATRAMFLTAVLKVNT